LRKWPISESVFSAAIYFKEILGETATHPRSYQASVDYQELCTT